LRLHNLDILVADDELEMLRLYKYLFEDWGHNVVTSKDGEECLDTYQKTLESNKSFDLVILDYRMPKKNGMEVAKRIVATVPTQKLLMITAYGGLIDLREKPEHMKIITKPFEVEELESIIWELSK
jgi:two-component system chemotaxis response regulator CheY